MLKLKPVLVFLTSVLLIAACTKINESTELGGDLIPGVDNINTFEANLEVNSDNRYEFALDSTEITFSDYLGVGQINDPEFGTTSAQAYFNLYKFPITSDSLYPFIDADRDSITIDSVVLSLAFSKGYGDLNSTNTIEVHEISTGSAFKDTAFYKLNHTPDFALGPLLGTRSYKISDLDDSVYVKFPTDTITRKFANVIRVKLDNSFGDKIRVLPDFIFKPEAFREFVKGLSVRATSGNSITYFNDRISIVYIHYTARINGKDSAAVTALAPYTVNSADKSALRLGKAMIVKRSTSGGLSIYGNTGGNDPYLHILSAPGTKAYLNIPALSTFQNAVIHRAELIFSRISSSGDNLFTPPPALILDYLGTRGPTAFYRDMQSVEIGRDYSDSPYITLTANNPAQFGGFLKSDEYKFEITRYVQSVVTRKEGNSILRLFAPLRTNLIDSSYLSLSYNRPVRLSVNEYPADGRVVIGGGSHPDPARRPRLRIIYSKL